LPLRYSGEGGNPVYQHHQDESTQTLMPCGFESASVMKREKISVRLDQTKTADFSADNE